MTTDELTIFRYSNAWYQVPAAVPHHSRHLVSIANKGYLDALSLRYDTPTAVPTWRAWLRRVVQHHEVTAATPLPCAYLRLGTDEPFQTVYVLDAPTMPDCERLANKEASARLQIVDRADTSWRREERLWRFREIPDPGVPSNPHRLRTWSARYGSWPITAVLTYNRDSDQLVSIALKADS